MTQIQDLCGVGLMACLSVVLSVIVLRYVLEYLRGRGEWIADALAVRRWGHIGQECKKEAE